MASALEFSPLRNENSGGPNTTEPTNKSARWNSRRSCWWGKVDSDHRSQRQQIYSLPPLATREFPRIRLIPFGTIGL